MGESSRGAEALRRGQGSFTGWEREERSTAQTGNMTMEALGVLVDAVVMPNRTTDEDKRPISERFAVAAWGKGQGTDSGFKKLARKRKEKDVQSEYSTVQGYTCVRCKKLSTHDIALRPPGYLETILRPGPKVSSFPEGCAKDDLHVVYNDEHKEHLERAGYEVVARVHYYKPGVPLPAGFEAIDPAPPQKRKRMKIQPVPSVQPPPDGQGTSHAQNSIQMPPKVPEWTSVSHLVDMMERPFFMVNERRESIGPFTPIYRWPQKRKAFGGVWAEGKTSDAVRHLYMDYYFMKVHQDSTLERLRKTSPSIFKDGKTPLETDPFPNVKSVWRNDKCPDIDRKKCTWRDHVLSYLEKELGEDYRTPFVV